METFFLKSIKFYREINYVMGFCLFWKAVWDQRWKKFTVQQILIPKLILCINVFFQSEDETLVEELCGKQIPKQTRMDQYDSVFEELEKG